MVDGDGDVEVVAVVLVVAGDGGGFGQSGRRVAGVVLWNVALLNC